MFTVMVHAYMVAMAGPRFMWDNGTPGHKPTSDAKVGMRLFMWEFANGRCAFCGKDVDFMESELCHIVSRGPKRKGFLFGNLANGCAECNIAQKENGPVVEFHDILFPELVPGPNDNPGIPFLTEKGREEKANR